MKNGKILRRFKKSVDAEAHKITEKIGEASEVIDSGLTGTGEKIEKKTRLMRGLSKFHLGTLKKEGEDIKKALSKTDLIYLKTDALVVVIRKLGGLDEFLGVFEKLTKEGYLLVWTEPVTSILPVGYRMVGNFYYFQKGKYVA
jgi:hypothetical protein